MFTGTVVSSGGQGFWFAEQDGTRDSVFVHISEVAGRKYLHNGDRIRFNIGVNPKTERTWATDVELVAPAPAGSNGDAL